MLSRTRVSHSRNGHSQKMPVFKCPNCSKRWFFPLCHPVKKCSRWQPPDVFRCLTILNSSLWKPSVTATSPTFWIEIGILCILPLHHKCRQNVCSRKKITRGLKMNPSCQCFVLLIFKKRPQGICLLPVAKLHGEYDCTDTSARCGWPLWAKEQRPHRVPTSPCWKATPP